jgi:hypothetical protein
MKVVEGWYGGPGGQISRLIWPANTPIVLGIFVGAEGVDTIVVNNIHLYCGLAASNQQQDMYPSAIFDGPGYKPSPAVLGIGSGGKQADQRQGQERCPAGQVAVGVHGRAGEMIDAMGLICDGPRICNARPLVRVKTTAKTSPTTAAPLKSVCDSARVARARNSPTAPGLEAQCKAELAKITVLEEKPVRVQNPALQVLVPNVKNAEVIKADPNNPEFDLPMR